MKNKNRFKLLGLAILVTAIIFSFTVCSSGGAGGGGAVPVPPGDPASTKYESTDLADNTYVLEITKVSGRAVYIPKTGDTYVLTINPGNKISRGTIIEISGDNLKLKPSNPSSGTFTVTIVETNTAALLTQISGTIVTDKGDVPEPGSMNPVRVYEVFEFGANKWHPDEYESWSMDISLSDFTTKTPKIGDVFKFRISGKTDKPFKGFGFELACHTENWSEYRRLGGSSGYIELPETFDRTFQFTVENAPLPNSRIYLGFANTLWNVGNQFDTGERLPEKAQNGDLMATINNFRISLIPQ
jgi:hypothetical protein